MRRLISIGRRYQFTFWVGRLQSAIIGNVARVTNSDGKLRRHQVTWHAANALHIANRSTMCAVTILLVAIVFLIAKNDVPSREDVTRGVDAPFSDPVDPAIAKRIGRGACIPVWQCWALRERKMATTLTSFKSADVQPCHS